MQLKVKEGIFYMPKKFTKSLIWGGGCKNKFNSKCLFFLTSFHVQYYCNVLEIAPIVCLIYFKQNE